MATANHIDENVTVSSEAVELLSCFVAELDSVILNLAKECARERLPAQHDDAPLEVEADDVKTAADAVLLFFKQRIAEGKLPNHMKEAIDGFERCFSEKCEKK